MIICYADFYSLHGQKYFTPHKYSNLQKFLIVTAVEQKVSKLTGKISEAEHKHYARSHEPQEKWVVID